MKEFFEKIVVDSAGKIAENLTDKITKSNKVEENANYCSDNSDKKIGMKNVVSKKGAEQKEMEKSSRQNFIEHDIGVINAFSKNKRLSLMVTGAAFGLVFCLIVLTTYKENLPGEVVGIISTITGIFGACLKDAYSFEFGASRENKVKDNDDRLSKAILEQLKK